MIDGFNSWNTKLNLDVDELIYNGLRITGNWLGGHRIRGSLHGTKNKGEHNANDYSMTDFRNTLNQLRIDIGLNADITLVNGFEFGVNIKLPINPNKVLERIILHKSNTGNRTKNYVEFEYEWYSLKCYNKSELSNLELYKSENILRIELKIRKMACIRKKGVRCMVLSDLLDVYLWQRMEQILVEAMQECLFVDFTTKEIKSLSTANQIRCINYANPSYWSNLHEVNRNTFSRDRKRCAKLSDEYSRSTLKENIINLIREKCVELRNFPT